MFDRYTVRFSVCCLSLFMSFLMYGVAQERVMSHQYESEYFGNAWFLILVNRLITTIGAAIGVWVTADTFRPQVPLKQYAQISIINLTGTYFQYESLKYIIFPTQALFKSSKTLPVLVWGWLFGKRFPKKDVVISFAIMTGAVAFVLSGDIMSHHESSSTTIGLLCVTIFLVLDGLQIYSQERVFHVASTMGVFHQMFFISSISLVIALVYSLVSGSVFEAIRFASRHPTMLKDAAMLAACSFVGQSSIVWTIREFGALTLALVMTTRLLFSSALSCLQYAHDLSGLQWASLFTVVILLYWRAWTFSSHHQTDLPFRNATTSDIGKNQEHRLITV